MNKEEIEYTIKTNRNTGEIMFSRGDYSFKQWGVSHEIIDLIEQLQQENKQLKELEKWLKSEIKRIEDIKNPKHSTTFSSKPYGREKEYYEIMINSYKYCLDKLKELKEGKINE